MRNLFMWKKPLLCCAFFFAFTGTAAAHFGMLIPSTDVVENPKEATLSLDFSFSHPMEMVGMPLAKPATVNVIANGKAEDITLSLKPAKIMKHDAWQASYTIKKPGVYQFTMEPVPYWEPAEDCYIIHYTKTYVSAFGEEEGWDEPAGLKTEIVPLTRPFGNYAGNVFQGQVLLDGKPVPGALVEVEYYNKDNKYVAPNDIMITQSVKADPNGIFTYAIPFAGWWGFAALNTAENTKDHNGAAKAVELGAILWTNFTAPTLQR